MSFWQSIIMLSLISICGLLIVVVLLQKGRGGGLAGAFGGAGGGGSAFGAKTGDVFTWITVVLALLFMLVSVVGNFAMDMSTTPVPVATIDAPDSALPEATPFSPAIQIEGGEVVGGVDDADSLPLADGDADAEGDSAVEGDDAVSPDDAVPADDGAGSVEEDPEGGDTSEEDDSGDKTPDPGR